jgi:hypothetical protein
MDNGRKVGELRGCNDAILGGRNSGLYFNKPIVISQKKKNVAYKNNKKKDMALQQSAINKVNPLQFSLAMPYRHQLPLPESPDYPHQKQPRRH